ncbi:MAG: TIGR03435 family protein [Acidobacteriaceae bacterium]
MMGISRRALLGGVAGLALGVMVCGQTWAQAPAAKGGIVGTWQGTLHAPGGHDLRTVLKVTKDDKGALHAMFYSIDQSGRGIATSSVSFDNGALKFGIDPFSLTYEGKVSADGNSVSGTVTQGDHPLPLVLERTTPETAWTIPAPPPRIPPMPADAHPTFEVATIKPTKPDEKRTYLIWRGADMQVVNFSLNDLVMFAYNMQKKQIVGGPDWMATDKFDIDAKPDIPGQPNDEQLKGMLQKLLADRYALKFHKDQKEMSAYVLVVGKSGPKMKQNTSNPKGLPGLFFGPIGTLHVMNATMGDFTHLMQSTVLDRPVVDRTGLTGRWDFTLKWTPDESQFVGMGVKIPPPSADAANAAPPLFTAIQEQLDLKLEAQKTQVPVLVIDHVDHPSPN